MNNKSIWVFICLFFGPVAGTQSAEVSLVPDFTLKSFSLNPNLSFNSRLPSEPTLDAFSQLGKLEDVLPQKNFLPSAINTQGHQSLHPSFKEAKTDMRHVPLMIQKKNAQSGLSLKKNQVQNGRQNNSKSFQVQRENLVLKHAAISAKNLLSEILTKENAPEDLESLKSFLEFADKAVLKARPDLFLLKMQKAVKSDETFNRAFPNLLYLKLRSAAQAAELLKTPTLFLPGDFHAGNIEIIKTGKGLVPQVNDFDDAGRAPVAADLARMMVQAVLWETPDVSSKELYQESLDAYHKSLEMDFKEWSRSIFDEKSVTEAKFKDRQWFSLAGTPIQDKNLSSHLLQIADLSEKEWQVFDRMGVGGSSIGMIRYLLASASYEYAKEIKELRPSALELFTGKPQALSDEERVGKAYSLLRAYPVAVKTFKENNRGWLVRRREGKEAKLDILFPKSAARVMAGLLAQIHRSQIEDISALKAAAVTVNFPLIISALKYMKSMRSLLAQLLKNAHWSAQTASDKK